MLEPDVSTGLGSRVLGIGGELDFEFSNLPAAGEVSPVHGMVFKLIYHEDS